MVRLRSAPPLLLLLTLALGGPSAAEPSPTVRFVDFETNVNPITAQRIVRAIDDAEAAGDELVLIRLDTPGGLVSSMETIVKRMLAARVPVVVWVGPSGAKAASAGFFLLLAADVAAMAPGTRTGAASTVFGTGEETEGNVLLKKSNEDLAALLRSICEHRGRDADAAQRAVFEAKAYEEQVAIEKGLADVVAATREELLQKIDSLEVRRFDGRTVILHTAGAQFVTTEFSLRHDFMEFLALPVVAYLLLMLGMLGIYVEFTHPGVVFPGVVGALCLLLFALSAQVLPISAIGLILILLAVVMFVLEIKVTSYGMLTLGGVACLIMGSWMLVDGPIPELRVPLSAVLPLSVTLVGTCALAMRFALRAQRVPVGTGSEGIVGSLGTVSRTDGAQGKVQVHGEIWNARWTGEPVAPGTRVRIVRVDDMWLTVEPECPQPIERS